jgi:hypothetical protein
MQAVDYDCMPYIKVAKVPENLQNFWGFGPT